MSGVTPGFRRAWLALTWLLALCIVVFSLTAPRLTPEILDSDKLTHAVAYFALVVMAAGVTDSGSLWRIVGYCLGLGALLEMLQGVLTVDRMADWGDLAADAAGILSAWLLLARRGTGWARLVYDWIARRRRT